MQTPLHVFVILIALGMAGGPAQAQSRHISGTAGYLSEWQLDGVVTQKTSTSGRAFSGPVTWKHVGLCSVNGPQEKHGEIRFEIEGSGARSRVHATLSFEAVQCTYDGNFSDTIAGLMDCSDAKGVPLALSYK